MNKLIILIAIFLTIIILYYSGYNLIGIAQLVKAQIIRLASVIR